MKLFERLKKGASEAIREEVAKSINADILPLVVSGIGTLLTFWTLMSAPRETSNVYYTMYNTYIYNYYGRKVK